MALAGLVESIRSGVISINFLNSENKIFSKGSGFMSEGYLITNNHLLRGPSNTEMPRNTRVWIRNCDDSITDFNDGMVLGYEDLMGMLVAGSDPNLHDYAIFDIQDLRSRGLHNFNITNPDSLIRHMESKT